MPPFTSKSKQQKRSERDRRRARSTPAHAPPLSTLPPAPSQHPHRGVNPTLFTRSGCKVIPSAKAIEENGTSAQTHTQPAQHTQEVTDNVFDVEFHEEEWDNGLDDPQPPEDDGGLLDDLMNTT
jgi:hypothetical protein